MQNDNNVNEKKIGDYTIKIYYDENPESPREWDNIGTMVCFHEKYNLGDKHTYKKRDYNSWEGLAKDIIKSENVDIILPLYLYEHSGLTISTSSFNDKWDSGQIGWIYVSKEKAISEYSSSKKVNRRMTPKIKEMVTNYLLGEVETYDQYLKGDIYGYKIFDKDDEEIDSCYGYYGIESCMEEAESIIECLNKGV